MSSPSKPAALVALLLGSFALTHCREASTRDDAAGDLESDDSREVTTDGADSGGSTATGVQLAGGGKAGACVGDTCGPNGAGGGKSEVAASCGDGLINKEDEACDDGNSESSDGCTADCRQIEANFVCPTPGMACISAVACGDGKITGTETCDDGNEVAGDGCGASCALEPGWSCPFQGLGCTASGCGDGVIAGTEECDWDPKQARPAGCGASCKMEDGYDCDRATFACAATACGNSRVERGEQCDDGNEAPFDGCYGCRQEPKCKEGVCTSTCGDGQRYADEECDDGNVRSGDGCSSACRLEVAFSCASVESSPPASLEQPVLVRDFIGVDRSTNKESYPEHPDFNRLVGKGGIPDQVEDLLDSDGKPVYACPGGDCNANPGHQQTTCLDPNPCRPSLSSRENFAQWYRDVPGVNIAVPIRVTLTRQPSGGYLYDSADTSDGKDYFDPLGKGGWVAAGSETLAPCGPNGAADRNVSFTSETHFWFEYQGGERFDFAGDDDTWVFVNGRLAIDIGGVHAAKKGYFALHASNGTATVRSDVEFDQDALGEHDVDLGLRLGGVYEVVMFQAERNECGSNFKVTLNNFNRPKSSCASVCGDGLVASDELCDDGEKGNDGSYGHCGSDCRSRGPYCGDGRQDPKEQCDDGVNLSQYGGCAPGCGAGASCGDGVVDSGFEECDDGVNDGGYGECFPGCTFNDRCGDGQVQADGGEQCDDKNRKNGDGCDANCQREVVR